MRQFRRMIGVSQRYLQSYLDEYTWQLIFIEYVMEEIYPLPDGDYSELLVNQEIQNDSTLSSSQKNIIVS